MSWLPLLLHKAAVNITQCFHVDMKVGDKIERSMESSRPMSVRERTCPPASSAETYLLLGKAVITVNSFRPNPWWIGTSEGYPYQWDWKPLKDQGALTTNTPLVARDKCVSYKNRMCLSTYVNVEALTDWLTGLSWDLWNGTNWRHHIWNGFSSCPNTSKCVKLV